MANDTIPLEKRSTDELERAIAAGSLDFSHTIEAKRILRERYAAPDRRVLFWTLVFAAIAAIASVVALFR